jgi:2'-5' RNA ligase
MRVFISLNINEETRTILKNFQKSVKEDLGLSESGKVKWESPDKFHITMFFIGEISDGKVEELKVEFKKIHEEKIGAISIRLGKLNAFPNMYKPRVLFTEVIEKDGKLPKLNDAINSIMKRNGFEESGKFHPHITLGRVRRDNSLHGVKERSIIEESSFEVQGLNIMKSVLSKEGSEHESIFFAIL